MVAFVAEASARSSLFGIDFGSLFAFPETRRGRASSHTGFDDIDPDNKVSGSVKVKSSAEEGAKPRAERKTNHPVCKF